jgi:hypothetical protein
MKHPLVRPLPDELRLVIEELQAAELHGELGPKQCGLDVDSIRIGFSHNKLAPRSSWRRGGRFADLAGAAPITPREIGFVDRVCEAVAFEDLSCAETPEDPR